MGRSGMASRESRRRTRSWGPFPFSARITNIRIFSATFGIIIMVLSAVAALRMLALSSVGASDGDGRSGAGTDIGVGVGMETPHAAGMERGRVSEGRQTPVPADQDARIKEFEMLCNDYLKTFGTRQEESWGMAPEDILDAGKFANCSGVIANEGFSLADPPTGGRKRAIVVVWNSIWGWFPYSKPDVVKKARETCSTQCVFTDDRSLTPVANGVLFHAPTHERDFPVTKPHGSKYVFLNLEPITMPRVNALLENDEYMARFDLTMTYESDSDVPLGYVGRSLTRYFASRKASMEEKDGLGNPDAIAMFVSDCDPMAKRRTEYIEELMKYAPVHSYGTCLNNREEPDLVPGGATANKWGNKGEIIYRYKFYLAFENTNRLRDFVTEKVYNGLQAGTLPVYWGAENVDEFVPRGSIVKAADFKSPKALARHLLMLSEDDEAYEEYFKWRNDPVEEARFRDEVVWRSAFAVNAMCRLCERTLEQDL